MKKILLVNTNTEQFPYPVPPLGMSLVAASIEKHYDVTMYDGVSQGHEALPEVVREVAPDLIGFSIRNIDNVDAQNPHFYLDDIKAKFFEPIKAFSKVPIVLGGSGFSLFPTQLMKLFGADYGIRGEGEISFLQFLNAFFNNESLDHISGLTRPDKLNDSQLVANFEFQSSLDTRLDFNHYRQRGAYSIQTKRGCYHHCIYCTYPLIEGRKYRTRNPEDVADEVLEVEKRMGPQLFEFVDSTFNDPPGYAEKICRALINKKVKSRFRTMGINPANSSDELFTLMKDAGFVQVDCTPDSASPTMIENFKKNFTIDKLIKVAELIKKHDFPTMWFFIAGGPGETLDTFRETTSFVKNYIDPLNMVHITSGIRIFPGTEMQEIALNQGIISPNDDLLHPKFYFSPDLDKEAYQEELQAFAKGNLNFIPASETKASAEMMAEAMKRRAEHQLLEPMFKTLLRIRHDWVKEGRMIVGG